MTNRLWLVLTLVGAAVMLGAVLPMSVSILANNIVFAFWSLIAFVFGAALFFVGSWFENRELRKY